MTYIETGDEQTHRLSFYLAMEEYIARHLLHQDDCFFMWQVEPSVIFGRNQVPQNEVNIEYCIEHGIQTYRRKSGGGCVYADQSNVMLSYITPDANVADTFSRYMRMVADTLQEIGIDAHPNDRNDIMIGDRKVSGNAFYHIPGRSIVHGTMLYDTNMQNMVGAITPSDEKLVSKGINSVRQHITLLKDHIEMDIEAFKTFVKNDLCSREVVLDEAAMDEISRIEEEYLTPEFIYGNNPRYNIQRQGRIEGVGDFVVNIEMKNDVIKDVDIKGDYFLVGDIGQQVIAPLIDRHLTKEDLEAALPDRLDDVILNMKKADFVGLLLNK